MTVNGDEVLFSPSGISLTVSPDAETVVELTQVLGTVNPRKEELRTNLLTRIQGENIWKNTVLNGDARKMPRYIREALEELDALI